MGENKIVDVSILTTGGTIEKTYDEQDGILDNRESIIKNILLSRLRLPYTRLNIVPILCKDSLNMNDDDRAFLLLMIKKEMESKNPIVVLHGTDSMALSASFCKDKITNIEVPLIFTGAMKPLGILDSDASQNVTEALLAAKIIKPGVYISFHNQIFDVPNVRKNKEAGTFEAF
ncbi:MAG: asparaginase domain-containing protein [Bdellovibrionota bacterium]|nr:asparaginase domain-containing protein [Bdellovibrionota bacterium]